jgi:HEAT repeat protein
VRVTPKDYTPEPLPNFEKMSDEELVKALDSPSHVRTLAAQRTLMRRGENPDVARLLVKKFVRDSVVGAQARKSLSPAGIAALFALGEVAPDSLEGIDDLIVLESAGSYFARFVGDFPKKKSDGFTKALESGLKHSDPKFKLEAIASTARLGISGLGDSVAEALSDSDPVILHTAYRALAKMSAHEAAFSKINSDDTETRKAAAWALMRMHKKEVVDGLLARLKSEDTPEKRRPLLSTLARLYHKEAEWKGDSWGTRPDTRGPYYQLATWEESDRILKNLKAILKDASAEEAAFIITKLNKNRIPANDALERIIDLALKDDKLIPVAIKQIASGGSVPAKAIPLVVKGASDPETPADSLADAVKILVNSDDKSSLPAVLKALVQLDKTKGAGKQQAAAKDHFSRPPSLRIITLCSRKWQQRSRTLRKASMPRWRW